MNIRKLDQSYSLIQWIFVAYLLCALGTGLGAESMLASINTAWLELAVYLGTDNNEVIMEINTCIAYYDKDSEGTSNSCCCDGDMN